MSFIFSSSGSIPALPSLPQAYTTGKKAASSEAPSSTNKSKVLPTTHSGRASCLSTLLTTTMILSPKARAFLRTNRVWGIGPSLASTRRRAPSAIFKTRSTSPPKSAWPGVSIMLIFVSFHTTEAFLEKIVIPRSRSSSFESKMASWPDCSLLSLVFDCRNKASTSVVLP